jgi:hypothetical protein
MYGTPIEVHTLIIIKYRDQILSIISSSKFSILNLNDTYREFRIIAMFILLCVTVTKTRVWIGNWIY